MSQSDQPETRNFFCDHCGGEIRVPFDLPPTTAPCPFCQQDITSPAPPLPDHPAEVPGMTGMLEAPKETAEEKAEPTPGETTETGKVTKADEFAGAGENVEEAQAEMPVLPVEPEEQEEAPVPPGAGSSTPPLSTSAEPEPAPRDDRGSGEEARPDATAAPRRSLWPSVLFLLAVLVLVGLVIVGLRVLQKATSDERGSGTQQKIDDNQFVRDGWKGVATGQLRGFLAASSLEEKAAFVIGGEDMLDEMREFYRSHPAEETDMPLDAFSHYPLDLEDRQRGVFLMRYERPAQFNIREFFRPVAPLEVQYGVEESSLLLSSVAALGNFSMDPVHAMVFFKREGDELLIDWETYVQTKHRTLRDFSASVAPGQRGVFRVVIQEDLPGFLDDEEGQGRVYRLTDPAQASDYVKVRVAEDSELGLLLSELNWIGVEGGDVPTRTATVELGWTDGDDPRLELVQVVCWEFLGLGGTEGNTTPAPEAPAPAEPAAEASADEEPVEPEGDEDGTES